MLAIKTRPAEFFYRSLIVFDYSAIPVPQGEVYSQETRITEVKPGG